MVLRLGDYNNSVKELQKILGIQSDGHFGKGTQNAVKKFQSENNLVVDGIVGPTTWERIKNSDNKTIRPVILKMGSKTEAVRKLQESLGLVADSYFGAGTKAAVMKFQSENNLVSDGIVGPSTWRALGFTLVKVTKPKKEPTFFTTKSGLVINKYYLPKDEYMTGSVPKYVFLHHTAGWQNPYQTIDNWDKDSRGKISTEFVLGGQSVLGNNFEYDGELVKCMPDGGWGWHLGTGNNNVHKNSVGIEVNNFGYVTEGGYYRYSNGRNVWVEKEKGRYYTYSGANIHPSQMVELDKPFRGHKFWHKYSNKQISTLKKWLYYIAERDNIDIREGIPELILEKGASAFDYVNDVRYGKIGGGVWSHTTVRKDKFDMFPQKELLDMLVSL